MPLETSLGTHSILYKSFENFWGTHWEQQSPKQSNSPHPLSQKEKIKNKNLGLFSGLLHCLIAWAKFILLHLFVTILDLG
jgi:hypothetical protein